jgi:hypothetical protein
VEIVYPGILIAVAAAAIFGFYILTAISPRGAALGLGVLLWEIGTVLFVLDCKQFGIIVCTIGFIGTGIGWAALYKKSKPLAAETKPCPHCGRVNSIQTQICPHCEKSIDG